MINNHGGGNRSQCPLLSSPSSSLLQSVARARRKSSAKFATINPAPKIPVNNKTNNDIMGEVPNENDDNTISITVNAISGSILDINPNIKPHEVIYDDDGNLMKMNKNNDNIEIEIDINKIHILLKQTSKCDIMLRRRMRNELEKEEEDDDDQLVRMEYIDDNNEYKSAKVGLSNINYVTSSNLMNMMSNLLGEYEKLTNNGLQDIIFYKWRNKIGEKLSTA